MEDKTLQFDDSRRNVEILNSRDFCDALNILLKDPDFPEENISTKAFVEAMQAWLVSMEGRNDLFKKPCDDFITWADLYKLLQAAAVYE